MSLTTACRLFGISRQAVYKQEKSYEQKLGVLTRVKAMVRSQRMDMPRIGTRKLYYLLKGDFAQSGIKIGRDGLFDCLRREHMLIKPLKSYTKTTWSKHWLHKHPNLIKEMTINAAEQLWVSDITYIKPVPRTVICHWLRMPIAAESWAFMLVKTLKRKV